MTDLSIIIVNWNSTAWLLKCLESVYAQTHETAFEVVVVDNASPDGDIGIVKQRYPEVVVIESPVNLGFAGANNLGFRMSRGENVVFLNPDTELISPAFDLMLKQVRSLPSAGAVGCTLLNEDQSLQISCIQTFPTILNQLLDLDFFSIAFLPVLYGISRRSLQAARNRAASRSSPAPACCLNERYLRR